MELKKDRDSYFVFQCLSRELTFYLLELTWSNNHSDVLLPRTRNKNEVVIECSERVPHLEYSAICFLITRLTSSRMKKLECELQSAYHAGNGTRQPACSTLRLILITVCLFPFGNDDAPTKAAGRDSLVEEKNRLLNKLKKNSWQL